MDYVLIKLVLEMLIIVTYFMLLVKLIPQFGMNVAVLSVLNGCGSLML